MEDNNIEREYIEEMEIATPEMIGEFMGRVKKILKESVKKYGVQKPAGR